jgi:hypothetical protein
MPPEAAFWPFHCGCINLRFWLLAHRLRTAPTRFYSIAVLAFGVRISINAQL